ncbi:MAG TPA: hypothetical protein PKV82_05785 [Anaerolineae bacterium]|nr:hypothetical protein [Anaerolineae bacterium]
MQNDANNNEKSKGGLQLLLFESESGLPVISVLLDTTCTLLTWSNSDSRTIDDNCACEPG